MENWQHIYENFDPIAFEFFVPVHWYGIMYVLALLSALFIAKWFVKRDNLAIKNDDLDNYFLWVEIGVILGARVGYVLFYDPHTSYYLTHPWQIFNPFLGGQFVGIRGMSFHGALIGFLVASWAFTKRHNFSFWFLLDLVAISVPLGYVFGRVGNFLNQELVGRETTVEWGIYVYDVLRHPSQLYEAFLEGLVVFVIMFILRKYKSFDGQLALIYGGLYSMMRFIAEFWREPDVQIGFIAWNWLTQGQLLSFLMFVMSVTGYFILRFKNLKKVQKS